MLPADSSSVPSSSEETPKKRRLRPFTSWTVRSLSSFPLSRICPFSLTWSKISVLARRTPSRFSRYSRWQVPMLVITAVSGRAIFASLCMSPKWEIPISRTAISSSSVSRKTVRGRPRSLLKFPSVLSVRSFRLRTEAIISFVLVLPTLPVTPVTGMPRMSR